MSLSQPAGFLSCQCPGCLPGLLPHLAGVVTEDVRAGDGRLCLLVRSAAERVACPRCGALSGRVHDRYLRRLRDLPVGGLTVVIWLAVRRLRCPDPGCGTATFTEQPEGLAVRYARRTPPLAAALTAQAVALAGRAGARLGSALGTPASRDSMIRLVMAVPLEETAASPEALGIDDFALRRGHVYGTVLIDAATGNVVDLLPDREAATVRQWLAAHPGARVICRDRAGGYAEAAREGAPGAVQVADRWHLWHNLCEKAYQTAAAHRAICLRADPGTEDRQEHEDRQGHQEPPPGQLPSAPGKPALPERTRQRHAQVHQLLAAGHTKTQAARILGLSRPTIDKYAAAATPGEVTPAARDSILDPYKPYLIRQWNAGTRNTTILHAQIKAHGYTGSGQQVRRFTRTFRDLPGPAPQPPPPVPSARTITSWLTKNPQDLPPDDAAALTAITAACPHLAELRRHIASFAQIMNDRTGSTSLETWLTTAQTSQLPALRSFARGIRKDHAAVTAGLTLPWNSGKVEGNVNKIKMIKRQMYGRASFPLLRKRVLLNQPAK